VKTSRKTKVVIYLLDTNGCRLSACGMTVEAKTLFRDVLLVFFRIYGHSAARHLTGRLNLKYDNSSILT